MRHRFALVCTAVAFGAAVLSAPARAQDSDIPCDAFVKNDDGTWTATRNITIPGPGRNFNVNQGAIFRAGGAFMGMDIAEQLDKQNCPATTVSAPGTAPGTIPGQTPAPGPASAPPKPLELAKYADANGNIDAQKLTCGQLASATQDEADFFGFWYSGWYNGLAKKHLINVNRVREGFRDIIVYCKANKDKRITQAIDAIRKQARR